MKSFSTRLLDPLKTWNRILFSVVSVPAPDLPYKPHTKAEPQVLPQMSSDLHQKALQSVEYGNIAESSYDNTCNVWVFEILFIFLIWRQF